jgi:WD40 repeat protein
VQTLGTSGVQFVAWSHDGSLLATGYGSNVEVWDGKTGHLLRALTVYSVSGLDWSPSSQLLAVGESSMSVRDFDADTGEELHPSPPNSAVEQNQQAAWSPDGKTVASAFSPPRVGTPGVPGLPPPHTPVPGENDVLIRLWDALNASTRRVLRMPAAPNQYLGQDSKLRWSSDGRYLAGLFDDSTVSVWDVTDTGQEEPKLEINSGYGPVAQYGDAPRDFEWAADGHTLATLGGSLVNLWDADTGKQAGMLPDRVPPPILPPSPPPTVEDPLHPQPPAVPPPMPTDAQGNTVTPVPTVLYPTLTSSPTYVYRNEEFGIVGGLAWSPDGRTLATFDGNNIRLWDPSTHRQTLRMASDGAIRKLAWSLDGGVLFSLQGEPAASPPAEAFLMLTNRYTFLDGTLKLWDTATGKELRSIYQDGLSDFVLSPDGKNLAVRVGITASLWSADKLAAVCTVVPVMTITTAATGQISPTVVPTTAQPQCGSWSVVDAPEPEAQGELRAVAVADGTTNDVWAVGLLGQAQEQGLPANGVTKSWTVHRNGDRWETVASPSQGDGDNVLNGVAAISSNDVWAVGYYLATTNLSRALILHWDGTDWSNVPAPELANNYGKGSALNAVSGNGPDDVWAVGTFDNAFTLTLHWDGQAWTQVPSPSPGVDLNTLTTVSAETGGEVWAGGQYAQHYYPAGMPQGVPFILRWDGGRWQPVSVTFDGTYISALGMAPDGAGWVIGGYAGEGGGGADASRWDGAGWASATLPKLGNIDAIGQSDVPSSGLNGLVVISRDSAWAVGTFSKQPSIDPSGNWQEYTLVEHWDGTSWAPMESPNSGTLGSNLSAVAAAPPHDLWAVGRKGQYGGPYKATVLHYSGPLTCSNPGP